MVFLFRLFRLLASLNYTRRTPLHALSPVIFHSRTRFVARVPSTANSPADGVEVGQADSLAGAAVSARRRSVAAVGVSPAVHRPLIIALHAVRVCSGAVDGTRATNRVRL